ncbi:MAG: SIS domain-containing protein [Chloroflexi bacterium]|nr:SIS domain-containing protein [Chloroflexota bacterium]
MINESLTSYCQRLFNLILAMEITKQQDVKVPLEVGANEAMQMILSVRANSGIVMVIGNGGSAAIASHMQNDLSKAVGVRSLVFHEPSLLTALANDD